MTALVHKICFINKQQQKLSSLLANGSTDKKTIYKLAVNAQRLRIIQVLIWYFREYFSYQLEYRRDSKLVLTSRVIVGRKDRKLQ